MKEWNNLIDLYNNKLNKIIKILNKNEISLDEWDIEFVKENNLKQIKYLEEKYIYNKDLFSEEDLKKLALILDDLYNKAVITFRKADVLYICDIVIAEVYYDLIEQIFYDTEFIILEKFNLLN